MVTGALPLQGRGSGTLPAELQQCSSLRQFKRCLKTSIRVVGLRRFVTLCKTAPYRNSLTYLITYSSYFVTLQHRHLQLKCAGPAFLQSPDPVVEEWLFLVFQSAIYAVQITSSSSENFVSFHEFFQFRKKKQKSLGARTTHLITGQLEPDQVHFSGRRLCWKVTKYDVHIS